MNKPQKVRPQGFVIQIEAADAFELDSDYFEYAEDMARLSGNVTYIQNHLDSGFDICLLYPATKAQLNSTLEEIRNLGVSQDNITVYQMVV